MLDKLKAYGFMGLSGALGILVIFLSAKLYNCHSNFTQQSARWEQEKSTLNLKYSGLELSVANDKALQATAAREQSETYRTLERRYTNDIESVRKTTSAELAVAKAAAAKSDLSAKRLSDTLNQYLYAFNSRHLTDPTSGASVTGERTAGEQSLLLLADLYRSSEQRARDFAAEADRSYASGQGCERSYDKIAN